MIENILWFVIPPLLFIGGVVGIVYLTLQFALIVLPTGVLGVVETEGQLIRSELTEEYDTETKRFERKKDSTIQFRDRKGQTRTFEMRVDLGFGLARGIIKVRYFAFAPRIARLKGELLYTVFETAMVVVGIVITVAIAIATGQWLYQVWGAWILGFLNSLDI